MGTRRVAARGEEEPSLPVIWPADEGRLGIDLDATLPPICFKCGVTEGVALRSRMQRWIPPDSQPIVFAMFAFCAPLALVLLVAQWKNVRIAVPLCGHCNHRWHAADRAAWTAAALAIAGAIGFVVVRDHLGKETTLCFWAATAIIGIFLLRRRRVMVRPWKLVGRRVELVGITPEAREKILAAVSPPKP